LAAAAINIAHVTATYDSVVAAAADEIQKVHGPVWDARSDFARNLVTVSSAIFAGSIAVLSTSDMTLPFFSVAALLASWFLLLCATAAGIYVLWVSVGTRSLQAIMVNSRPLVIQRCNALNPMSPTLAADITAIVADVVKSATAEVGRADKLARRYALACLWLFLVGLVIMFVFSAANLLG
jgi:hypothetical protein